MSLSLRRLARGEWRPRSRSAKPASPLMSQPTIICASWHCSHSAIRRLLLTMALLLAEDQIQRPAAARMRGRALEMGQYQVVSAARIRQRIGQNWQPSPEAILVDVAGQRKDNPALPAA